MGMQAIGRWLGEPKKVALLLLAAGLAAVAALGLASAASAATFSNNEGITINDGSELSCGGAATAPGTATPYPSVIAVSGLTGSVTDVNVTVSGLSHEFPDDAGLLLVSPTGQSVILMADSGGQPSVSGIELTFDDSASGPVPDNPDTALVSGTYLPSQGTLAFSDNCGASFPGAPAGPYGTSLSVFNGTDPNGNWQLYVIDDTLFLTGSITGWSLDINTTTADTTPPTVTNTTPDGTVSRTATVTATFDEEVQNVTSSTFILERKISVKKEPPKYVLVDATVDLINGSYVLTPVQDLPKGEYRATITTDVTDMADNALEDPVVWTFNVAK
jgi:subtilisin-like proprotein convertase family protein